jgi:hypothetical protein
MKGVFTLSLAALMAGIYSLPLCQNIEMLAGSRNADMCAKAESCCTLAEAGASNPASAPNCCDPTILTLERRDGVSNDAPLLPPPALVAAAWPDAVPAFSGIEAAPGGTPVSHASPPPLLLSLRL